MHARSHRLRHKVNALARLISDNGAWWTIRFLVQRFIGRPLTPLFAGNARRRLQAWARSQPEPVHIYVSALDWDYPYQQRPQHIARELVARGLPVIFVTPAIGYDRTLAVAEITSGLLLTPHRDIAIEACEGPIVHIVSTDARLDIAFVELVKARNGRIVYDYIDDLDDAVSSGKLTVDRRKLHERLLRNEIASAIVTSATALHDEVKAMREGNHALITNAADVAPFVAARRGSNLRKDFAAVVDRGRPIVGYYGSLASWLDCDLINAVARARPSYSIVVLGPDLDGSRSRLDASLDNLHILSAMRYSDLPRHAVWFDVCLVPFVINQITLATSPLKIFEYMALGKTTVSTDLPECRKYKSILIAPTADEFFAAVDRALEMASEPEAVAMARKEAAENTWASKVDAILALIAQGRLDDGRHEGRQ